MPKKRLIRCFLLVALGVVSSEAMAGEKVRLDGVELATSPTIRVFLTYVDRDGGVIAHKSKDNFKLLVDSGRQLPASMTGCRARPAPASRSAQAQDLRRVSGRSAEIDYA